MFTINIYFITELSKNISMYIIGALPDIPRDRFVLSRALNPLAVWAGMEMNVDPSLLSDEIDPPDSVYDRLGVPGGRQTDYPKGWRVQMIYVRW